MKKACTFLRMVTVCSVWLSLIAFARAQDLTSSPFAAPTSRTYTTIDGLPSINVTCIFQDRSGYLWVGTRGGLARWDGSDFRSWTYKEGFGSSVGSIGQLKDGRIICCSFRGVYVLDGEHVSPLYTDPRFRFYQREGYVCNDKLYMLLDRVGLDDRSPETRVGYIVCFDPAGQSFTVTDSVRTPSSPLIAMPSG